MAFGCAFRRREIPDPWRSLPGPPLRRPVPATPADQAHRVHGPDLAAFPAVPSSVSIA